MRGEALQRMRVTFGVHGPLIYLSVLDMGRLWERLLRRARVPLVYTQGFNPHPRIQFAAALPVGYSSSCEVMDLFLGENMDPETFRLATAQQAPPGLEIREVQQVPLAVAAPQSLMREAHYDVELWTEDGAESVQAGIAAFMTHETLKRQRRGKRGRMVEYDLRRLVYDLALYESKQGPYRLHMVVRCGSHGAGRPEQVLEELGVTIAHYTICRTRLVWGDGEERVS
jgi:radical SAM-linked protein